MGLISRVSSRTYRPDPLDMPVITQTLTPDLPEDQQTFLIGNIVKHKGGENRNKTTHYLVNWAGWGSKYDSWEPAEEIEKCADLLVGVYWENKADRRVANCRFKPVKTVKNSKPKKVA